jgi:Cu+-exporting ATPase
MAVMVGAGAASRRGILVKSAGALEAAGKAGRVIFDKTGTLTLGKPRVVEIQTASGWTEGDVLRLAAAVEAPSEHPIGKAIVKAASERGVQVPAIRNFRTIAGQGVRGEAEGRAIEVMRDETATCRVMIDGQRGGTITVADEPRGDAQDAVARLSAMGVQAHLLSGDRQAAAEAVAARIGIPAGNVIAEATPEAKVKFVAKPTRAARETAGARAGTVIMVGDGINDAAALAAADVGIAMASGTNIAMESADIIIPGDRVAAVADAVEIARLTLRTIKQNLFFAFIYNVVAIPLAALGLLGPMGPLFAAAAMGLSDVTVIGNALRLKARLAR